MFGKLISEVGKHDSPKWNRNGHQEKMEQGHSFEQTAAAEIAFRWSQVVSKFGNHFVIQNPIKFTKYHQVPSLPPVNPPFFRIFGLLVTNGDDFGPFVCPGATPTLQRQLQISDGTLEIFV
jgi:hypothetical protein